MKDTELGNALRRAADELSPAELVGPTLSAASRIRAHRRRGAVVGVAAVTVAAVASVSLWGGQSEHQPEPTRPSPTPTGPRTVSLTDLPTGKTPPFDYIGGDDVFHGSDGRTVRMPDPQTISTIGTAWVVGDGGRLVVLHDTRAGYSVTVDDGQPVQVLPPTGIFEDYRELARGPHGTVYLPGKVGHVVSVSSGGRISDVAIPGQALNAGTRDYFWRHWQGKIWRLDPNRLADGWTEMGPGLQPLAVYDADAVWVVGARCNALHDASSYRELWRTCGSNRIYPFTDTSPDGRYALVQRRGRDLQVIEARSGQLVLTIDAGSDRQVHAAFSSSWSGDDVLLTIRDKSKGQHQVVAASCDVTRATCWQIDLPSDARWIGPPTHG